MNDLHIVVNNKIATYQKRDGEIVCGNNDYQIVFTFDDEWNAHATKTARFIWNGSYTDVVFTGTVCPVPIISNAKVCEVGVYAGNLATTTPAEIRCVKSILCSNGVPAPPPDDVYAQIMALLAESPEEKVHETIPVLVLNGAGASDFSDIELYYIVRVYREVGSRYSGHQRLDIEPVSVSGETKAVFNTVHFFRDGQNRIDREQIRVCNYMADHAIRVFIQYFNGDTGAVTIGSGVSQNIYLTKDMDYVVVESR